MSLFAPSTVILVADRDDGSRIYDLMKDVLSDLGCHYKYAMYAGNGSFFSLDDGLIIRLWLVKACSRGIRANQIFISDSVDMNEMVFDRIYAPWFVKPCRDYAFELKTGNVAKMKESILHPTRWKPKEQQTLGESNG